MDFDYSPRTKELQAQLLRFMDEHIYPNEQRYDDEIAGQHQGRQALDAAADRSRSSSPRRAPPGLWNLFLPPTAPAARARRKRRDSA